MQIFIPHPKRTVSERKHNYLYKNIYLQYVLDNTHGNSKSYQKRKSVGFLLVRDNTGCIRGINLWNFFRLFPTSLYLIKRKFYIFSKRHHPFEDHSLRSRKQALVFDIKQV
jgi:hypothetical protein